MIYLADSGSTKTDWTRSDGRHQQTTGMNPAVMGDDDLCRTLRQVEGREEATQVYYYGAGVRPELRSRMRQLLLDAFPRATSVVAESDLLGAARALCGNGEGVACILGTGANSCLYDGRSIVANTPSLGYVIDDVGSGAALGRRFLLELYKGTLTHLRDSFEQWSGLNAAGVIEHVYRRPQPNRWLASLSPFVAANIEDDAVNELVMNGFREFFRRNIVPYGRRDLPVAFVGSIAWYYRSQLSAACEAEGFQLGVVLRSPLEGLLRYHGLDLAQ